jgi:KAP family P-loop domain
MNNNSQIYTNNAVYLDNYINLKYPPKFAMLIKGSWGSGKTYFVKQYINNIRGIDPVISSYPLLLKSIYSFFGWFERQKKINMGKSHEIPNKSIYYLSLYGAKNIAEVEERILTSIAKSQDSALPLEQLQQLYKAGREVIKGIKRIDILTIVPNTYFIQNILPKSSTLVFDDLERCNIDCNELFGYINSFLEHEDLKVVLIANEEKIDKNEKEKYYTIKEKLVGQEISIDANYDEAFDYFVNMISHEQSQKLLKKKESKQLISDLWNKAVQDLESKPPSINLRIIRKVITDFDRIVDALPENAQEHENFLTEILTTLFILSYEIKNALISTSDITQINENKISRLPIDRRSTDLKDEQENDPINKINKKWAGELIRFREFPSFGWWQLFFDKGVMDRNHLNEKILTNRYFTVSPDWLKALEFIAGFSDLSDEEFKELFSAVESRYQGKEYKELGEIKHILGLLLHLSNIGFISRSKENLLQEAKDCIDSLAKEIPEKLAKYQKNNDGYYGFSYFCVQEEYFKELSLYIEQISRKTTEESLPKLADNLLKIMNEDIPTFGEIIIGNKRHAADYMKTIATPVSTYPAIIFYPVSTEILPVLAYVDKNAFVNTFVATGREERDFILDCMNKRYAREESRKLMEQEFQWINSVHDLFNTEVELRKKNNQISGFILQESLEKLREIKDNLYKNLFEDVSN